jgi:intracellular multiplication protein IcmG
VPYLNELAGVEKPVPQQPAQPATQDNAAVDLSTDTTMAGIDADTGAQPDGTGAALDWADDTMTSDTGMDAGNNVMVGDADASGIPDTTTLAAADDFGLPPTTDGATDLSAPDATADANAGWGDMPVEDQEAQDTATAADPFGDVPMTDVPDTPVVTSPVPTTTASVPAADNAAVAALEKKVATLETTLNDLKKTTATKSDVDALKASLAKIEKAVARASSDTKPADVKTTTSEDVKPAPVKTTATKKVPVVRKSWVLRSAKPGMAWISEKGSDEIKTISVGDTVSGIGKVTAIAKDDGGRWVVNGTQGKINQ